MSDPSANPQELLPIVRVDYEKTTTVFIPPRRWEGYQVLRSELHGLARCAKQCSNDQQFFGIFVGAAIALGLAAATPGTDGTARMVYIGFAVMCAIGMAYFYRRARSSEREVDEIVKEIEEDQHQRLRAM